MFSTPFLNIDHILMTVILFSLYLMTSSQQLRSKKGNYVYFHWLEIYRVRGAVINNVRRPPIGEKTLVSLFQSLKI